MQTQRWPISTNRIGQLGAVVIFTAFLAWFGKIEIVGLSGISISLQTLIIIYFSAIFGWKIGVSGVAAYMAIGIAGYPVFLGGASGIESIVEHSGFFAGFLLSSVVVGKLSYWRFNGNTAEAIGLFIIGHYLILLMGFIHLWMMDATYAWKTWSSLLIAAVIKSIIGGLLLFLTAKLYTRRKSGN